MLILLVLCLSAVLTPLRSEKKEPPLFSRPTVPATAVVYFAETFSDGDAAFRARWVVSEARKREGDADVAKYDGAFHLSELSVPGTWPGDYSMVMGDKAKHYAISVNLDRQFTFQDETLVVQYEVNFQQGLDCGGAYMKLLSQEEELDLKQFHDNTGYTIMFGPDKCGVDSKIHFILRYRNPLSGRHEEKHCSKKPSDTTFFSDKKSHAFQLSLHSNGDFDVSVDLTSQMNGNIRVDMQPPIQPPEEVDDPSDERPPEWDERERIQDPEARRPDDWDEDAPKTIPDESAVKPDAWDESAPAEIPDPESVRPDDWDDDEDGDWEPPFIPNPQCEQTGCGEWEPAMIPNPSYKGTWIAPMIDNPGYSGVWAPRRIPNPEFFEDSEPYFRLTPIVALGFELWSMNEGIAFDNILITDSLQAGNHFLKDGWIMKYDIEKDARGERSVNSYIDYFVELANDYPYVWALYAAALVLPFIFCCWLCPTKKRAPRPAAPQADPPQEASGEPETDAPPPPEDLTEPPSPGAGPEIAVSDKDSQDDEGASGSQPTDASEGEVRKRTKKNKPRKDT